MSSTSDQKPASPSDLEQSNPPQKQKLIKLTILAYRNPNLTEDEFHHHWTHVHAPKVSAHLAKFGIVEYRQHHTPSSHRSTLLASLPSFGLSSTTDAKFADHDGYVELLMPDLTCYERARTDAYYTEVVEPDEAYFADMDRSQIAVGWEECWVRDGRVVREDE